jgi:hypothetical protein
MNGRELRWPRPFVTASLFAGHAKCVEPTVKRIMMTTAGRWMLFGFVVSTTSVVITISGGGCQRYRRRVLGTKKPMPLGAEHVTALEAFQRREGVSNLTEAIRIALWRFLVAEGLASPTPPAAPPSES